jgi:hypothetical protein
MSPPPGTGHQRARWREDLKFLFSGGIVERASHFFMEEAPILLIKVFQDAVMVLTRLGIITESHLQGIQNLPSPPGGQEIRIMEEFSTGIKVLGVNRKYTIFASVWFFKNQGQPLDGCLLIGIAPPGVEALVQAKVQMAASSVKATLKSDATAVIFERDNDPSQSN